MNVGYITTVLSSVALEWYDFMLFMSFGSIIGDVFFSPGDLWATQIKIYGTFAAGFVMRPLGSIIFGILGDKHGRRFALYTSVILMSISTAAIAVIPSYQSIGIYSTIMIIIDRMCQGFALGGQLGGTVALMEVSPNNRRGLVGGFEVNAIIFGFLFGALTAVITMNFTSSESLHYVFRYIFACGGVLFLIVGLRIKNKLEDTKQYIKLKSADSLSQSPFKDIWKYHASKIFKCICLNSTYTSVLYVTYAWMPNFLHAKLHTSMAHELSVTSVSMAAASVFALLSSYISDKIGRRNMMLFGVIFTMIVIFPMCYIVPNSTGITHYIARIILASCLGLTFGPSIAPQSELFPGNVRYTGVNFSRTISVTLFGGMSPLIISYLIYASLKASILSNLIHDNGMMIAGAYICIVAIVSMFGIIYIPNDTHNKPLVD